MLSRFSGSSLGLDYHHEIEREDSLSFRHHRQHLVQPPNPEAQAYPLDFIDIDLLALTILILTLAPILIELEIAVSVALLSIRIRLVDLRTLGEFAVCFQGTGLIGAVLEDHVALLVLVVAEREQDDVALVDPNLLAKFATDVCEAFGAIEAEGLQATVSEHLEDLGVFCVGGAVSGVLF